MKDDPQVSVILPVYNARQHLGAAVESICDQTFRNFELIIIDDGSTDDSRDLLQRYATRDSRVRIITNRTNAGLCNALNEGISAARGSLIARMDADDVSLPDRIERQVGWISSSRADVCGGWAQLIGTLTRREWRPWEHDDALKLQLCFNTPFVHPTVMIRTRLVKLHLYDEASLHGEDYDLWTRLAYAGAKFTNIQRIVLRYRVHSEQVSKSYPKEQEKSRERSQKRYVSRVIPREDAFKIVSRFSTPYSTPSLGDARELAEIIASLDWVTKRSKCQVFTSVLKYVAPASPKTYTLMSRFWRRFDLTPPLSFPLLVQSYLRLRSDGKMYQRLKRFVSSG